MGVTMEGIQNAQNIIHKEGIQFVRLEIEDMNGISRGVLLDVDHFLENIQEGFSFPFGGVGCIDFDGKGVHNDLLDEKINFSNGVLYPDLETFRKIPWKMNTASVICDLTHAHYVDKNVKNCLSLFHTRLICKRQLASLKNLGFALKSSLEYEFYIADRKSLLPIDNEENYSSTFFNEKSSNLAIAIMSNLKKYQIDPEKFHMECAPSMHEITIKPYFGIKSADNSMRFRSTVKETCLQNNVHALFMTNPYKYEYRSNGQFNHSLWDGERNINMFFGSLRNLSPVGKNWLAGLRTHSKALACLALTTYNCYQCFRNQDEGFDTGPMLSMNSAWGYNNRTVGFRVQASNPKASYIEYRIPGAAVNPYLMMAGILIAGMDGIKRSLALEDAPFDGNISKASPSSPYFDIPRCLADAVGALQDDCLFVKELGEDFIEAFVTLKKNEIERIKKHSDNEEELWKFQLQYYKHI